MASKSSGSFNDSIYSKNFHLHKIKQINEFKDLSRKSSVDEYIRDLIDFINNTENYFTTSSCSGRFIAFSQSDLNAKKDCKWIYVTHDKLTDVEVDKMIENIENEKGNCNEIHLKFEPFILHVCCKNMSYAKLMLDNAISNGFKNSGISIGSSKIILAVRCTQNLEIPISLNGKLLVDNEYLKQICELANRKFDDNFNRIDRFYQHLKNPDNVNIKVEIKEKPKKKDESPLQNGSKNHSAENDNKNDDEKILDNFDDFKGFFN